MKIKKKDKKPLEGFVKNDKLDSYSKMELFKEKLEMANHIIKTVGLPKGI